MRVTDLVKRYAGRPVVDGVTLTAAPGRVTAILGPNGAGKTTTVECCIGLRRPDAGRVRVLGLDPQADSARLRSHIGVMLQDGGLPMTARAGEALRHVAGLHRHPLPVRALEERLGIDAFARTTVRRLSGGQRQRLGLACALVGRPHVLFLDEPSAGLDPHARIAVWDLVVAVRSAGAVVLLTTHLMEEAERLADQVVIVDAGRVVAQGSPADLTDVGGMLSFTGPPRLDLSALLAALPEGLLLVEQAPGRYLLRGGRSGPGVAPTVVAAVTTWFAARDLMPTDLRVGRRSLEDVFLELTGRSLR